jgi:lysophospholipase L1-like esterase
MPAEPGAPSKLAGAGYWLAAVVSLLVVTCTRAGQHGRHGAELAPTQVIASVKPRPRARADGGPHSVTGEPPLVAPLHPRSDQRLHLPKFYAALHELARGARTEHVRVLWFGDSHTAADFMTDAVRQPLQQRFGVGGPGLVLLGLHPYRHAQASVQRHGEWRRVPLAPAAVQPADSAFFGLGGIGAAPIGEDASLNVTLDPGLEWARGPLRWEFVYRLPSDASEFVLSGGGLAAPEVMTQKNGQARASGLRSVVVQTDGDPSLFVGAPVAEPELFGVFIEAAKAGVVLDTLGINGARVQTPLGWQAAPWIEELRARAPALVVLSYGTNEVGDQLDVAEYRDLYARLLERIKQSGDTDCLILGPTERVLSDWTTYPRVLEIEQVQRRAAEELSCAFVSLVDTMGGPGSFRAWAFARPPLARKDRVHLAPAGYRQVGAIIAAQLLGSYAAAYPEPAAAQTP